MDDVLCMAGCNATHVLNIEGLKEHLKLLDEADTSQARLDTVNRVDEALMKANLSWGHLGSAIEYGVKMRLEELKRTKPPSPPPTDWEKVASLFARRSMLPDEASRSFISTLYHLYGPGANLSYKQIRWLNRLYTQVMG